MPRRRGRKVPWAVLLALAGLGSGAPERALADNGWLAQDLARLAALPHTLPAARDNAWFEISGGQRLAHGVTDAAYGAARPQLDAIAEAARPDLEAELDGTLRRLTFTGLEATARQHPLDYCAWVGAARSDGAVPSSSDLQATLSVRCRQVAADVVARLLDGHVQELDLRLAALPGLDLTFPRWLLGDLATPDGGGRLALDPLVAQRAYQDHLDQRIASALPDLRQELTTVYASRTWTGGPITGPGAACKAQLGPLASTGLNGDCQTVAAQWLQGLLPALDTATPQAVAEIVGSDTSLSTAEVCRRLLARWLPGEGYPASFRGAVDDTCLAAAHQAIALAQEQRAHAIDRAITAQVGERAAPILAGPNTYERLRATGWFVQPPGPWDGIVPPSDPEAATIRDMAQARYDQLVAPVVAASIADARTRIARAYGQAAGSAAAMPETMQLCGADGRGSSLPQAPGDNSVRSQVVAACVEAFDKFTKERVHVALDRAKLTRDDQRVLLIPTDEGRLRIRLVDLMTRAALADIQVRVEAAWLSRRQHLVLTPMGAEAPAFGGALTSVPTGYLLDELEPLPGWAADTAETIACVMFNADDLAGAQFAALLTVFGSFGGLDGDRPRTAGRLMQNGLAQLRDVQGRRACLAARHEFAQPARR